jgi:lipocalin
MASPSWRYLWISTRTPDPSKDKLDQAHTFVEAQAFDLTRLHTTQQTS